MVVEHREHAGRQARRIDRSGHRSARRGQLEVLFAIGLLEWLAVEVGLDGLGQLWRACIGGRAVRQRDCRRRRWGRARCRRWGALPGCARGHRLGRSARLRRRGRRGFLGHWLGCVVVVVLTLVLVELVVLVLLRLDAGVGFLTAGLLAQLGSQTGQRRSGSGESIKRAAATQSATLRESPHRGRQRGGQPRQRVSTHRTAHPQIRQHRIGHRLHRPQPRIGERGIDKRGIADRRRRSRSRRSRLGIGVTGSLAPGVRGGSVHVVEGGQRRRRLGLILGSQSPRLEYFADRGDLTAQELQERLLARRSVQRHRRVVNRLDDLLLDVVELLLALGGRGPGAQHRLGQFALSLAELAVAVLHLVVQLAYRVSGAPRLLLIGRHAGLAARRRCGGPLLRSHDVSVGVVVGALACCWIVHVGGGQRGDLLALSVDRHILAGLVAPELREERLTGLAVATE